MSCTNCPNESTECDELFTSELWQVLVARARGEWQRLVDDDGSLVRGTYDYCAGFVDGARAFNETIGLKIEKI